MSLKIKSDDVMWAPPVDSSTYHYGELDCTLNTGNYEFGASMEIKFHPKWVEQMNKIEIGDVVTDETGRVGLVMEERTPTPSMIKVSGVRRFLVSFAGEEEVCHSFVLHKIKEKK